MATKPTILVVDDDNDVRELAVAVLELRGYHVQSAADGPSALCILRSDEAIGLLVADVVMPGPIDGWELAHRALQLRPGLPVVMMSGLVRNETSHAEIAKAPFLRKPWHPRELVEQVKLAFREAAPRRPGARQAQGASASGKTGYSTRLSG